MLFLWNILLALVWCLLQGSIDLPSLAVGFILGFLVLRIAVGPAPRYFSKPRQVLDYFLIFLREMVVAQLRVAYDVATPRHKSNPGIIGLPLDARTDTEIAFFACILCLTPGTMVLEVTPDRRILYLHVMFLPEEGPGTLIDGIKSRLEAPLLEIMR